LDWGELYVCVHVLLGSITDMQKCQLSFWSPSLCLCTWNNSMLLTAFWRAFSEMSQDSCSSLNVPCDVPLPLGTLAWHISICCKVPHTFYTVRCANYHFTHPEVMPMCYQSQMFSWSRDVAWCPRRRLTWICSRYWGGHDYWTDCSILLFESFYMYCCFKDFTRTYTACLNVIS
jgi:hypothetical protein